MPASSHTQLMLTLLLVIVCLIAQGEVNANRQRRQAAGGNNRNIGIPPGSPNGLLPPNNGQFNPSNDRNNQQQSNPNLSPSSQGQGQPVRSRGFYNSPDFKPPSFSGEKPVGWFDTKYPNWVSNQDGQFGKIDGKNAPPSSLQGKAIQSQRQDGGEIFLARLAKQYADKGEKAYNIGQYSSQKGRGSVCTNRHSYNGYSFNRFYCPLPANTGMNQQDRFCCGIANYQYCCNEQEYNNQGGGYGDDGANFGKHRHSRGHSRTNRALAVILPIIGVLVGVGALVIIFLYYKKLQKPNQKGGASSGTTGKTDDYTPVPQDSSVDRPPVPPRERQNITVED